MDQIIVFVTLFVALSLFVWGKLRHDLVAIICLMILVFSGIVPPEEAFLGFANPAVVTVAMILVVSFGLQKSGLIDFIGNWVMKLGDNPTLQIGALCVIVCFASAFMNNVGALAVLMPVAISVAKKSGTSPSVILMPIAFSSLLGGMITLIGTPPNILISNIRKTSLGEPFKMFDFAPVGLGVAFIGLLFIVFIGWRLIPKRIGNSDDKEKFNINDYITEVRLTEDSKIVKKPLSDIHELTEGDIIVLNLVRSRHLIHAPSLNMILQEGDILTLEASSEDLKTFVENSKTQLVGKSEEKEDVVGGENISTIEAVVMADALISNQTAASLNLRKRYGVNLLAISRQGKKIRKRIDHVKFQVGDVLLLQGDTDKWTDLLQNLGCLPLADRGFNIGEPRKIILAVGIFLLALALIIFDLTQVQIAFSLAALLMVITKIIPLKEIYTNIDWPVIILLGAFLPIGTAMETSGGAETIANQILKFGSSLPNWGILALVLVVTMFLSDVINNAATVLLMAPVAIGLAIGLDCSPDPFLIAVAVGGSCAFLTPIGHQSNTLVMGPGGYKFTDYWRMGLPLEIIILVVSIPLILFFWPL
ncbi:SLC13 family permease [Rhodonellum sp.]|uniref:SLC13 family permease n=1 Tax=Rhodonellum sp. TaxID=2231180 RepID=UPI002719C73B|nr:SLC13 family permease [Rhodonellum sp.]MDO9551149.1 SLC13 family permease [Rhodonellum sp.]